MVFCGGGYTAGQKPGRSGCGDSAPRDLLHAEKLPDTHRKSSQVAEGGQSNQTSIQVCEEKDL
jgi:hypothetical protein